MEFGKPIAFILLASVIFYAAMINFNWKLSPNRQRNTESLPDVEKKVDNGFQFPKDWPRWEMNEENITMKDPPFILYTRLQKSGGRSMIGVMQRLAVQNGFFIDKSFTGHSLKNGFEGIVKSIASMRPPRIHHPHLRFIDFEKFGYKNPTFINVIRDPVDRKVSHYYFQYYGDNTPNHIKDTENDLLDVNECILSGNQKCDWSNNMVKIFCGTDDICSTGSPESVAMAKKNIDENYLFVGITEDFDSTVQIFERLLPDYFEGATEIWKEIGQAFSNATATKHKTELKPEARKVAEKMLFYDYEIYNYVKRKFLEVKKLLRIK